MAETGKVNNSNIRNYICSFVPEKLEAIPAFIKAYGRGFAKKQLLSNIVTVYTNEPKGTHTWSGLHRRDDKSITLIDFTQNGEVLSPEDIQNDASIEQICAHEAVHALLERSKKECKRFGIKAGTGLLERFTDGKGNEFELGRGFNEGYTEWMTVQAGYKSQAYPELTNMVTLLGLAIGQEKMMELGKGGIYSRFPKILDMDIDSTVRLLGIADDLYYQNDWIYTLNGLSSTLKSVEKAEGPLDEQLQQNYDSYQKLISSLKNTPEYALYISENHLEDNNSSFIDYLDNSLIKNKKESVKVDYVRVESMILERYFGKDLARIFDSDPVSKEDFEKCKSIMDLLNTSYGDIPAELRNQRPAYDAITFRDKFPALREKYMASFDIEQSNSFKAGTFKVLNYLEYLKQVYPDNSMLKQKHLDTFISLIAPKEFATDLGNILHAFSNPDEKKSVLEKLSDTKLFSVTSKDPNNPIRSTFMLSKDNFYNNYFTEGQQFNSSSNDRPKFDYTLSENEPSYESAMKNFMALRENVFKSNPNANIYIVSRDIVVKSNDEYTIYHLHDGELVPMKIEDTFDFQCQLGERTVEKQSGTTAIVKQSPVSSFFNSIRGKMIQIFGRNKKPDIIYGDGENEQGNPVTIPNTLDQYNVSPNSVKPSPSPSKDNINPQREDEEIR